MNWISFMFGFGIGAFGVLIICILIDPHRKTTNADRIRKMSDVELADYLATITNPNTAPSNNGYCLSGSTKLILEWLEQEYKT